MTFHSRPTVSAALLALAIAAAPARSAESFDACGGRFIDALPAVITTEGVWCLRKDLSTKIATGAAITIQSDNVTIDCNRFKVGGLAAGPDTNAIGIHLDLAPFPEMFHYDVGVRQCNVRGFGTGIHLDGVGVIIEDNRVDGSREIGIHASVSGVVRRNHVVDTGGPSVAGAAGIDTSWSIDVLDNTVDGVFTGVASPDSVGTVGIWSRPPGGVVRGNRVRGLDGVGDVYGMFMAEASPSASSGALLIADNQFDAVGGARTVALRCIDPEWTAVGPNRFGGFNFPDTGECRHLVAE